MQNKLNKFLSEASIEAIYAKNKDELLFLSSSCQPDLILISYTNLQAIASKDILLLGREEQEINFPLLALVHHEDSADENFEDVYIHCMNLGASDVIYFPCKEETFYHKMNAFAHFYQSKQTIQQLKSTLAREEEIAETLFTNNIDARNFGIDKVNNLYMQASTYRKDFYFCSQCPNGDINIMLGDINGFNGALTFIAIPLAETFRTMTAKGFKLSYIIVQMNKLLYDLLSSDVYFSACIVNLSSHQQRIQVFNAGAPEGLILNEYGEVRHLLTPQHIPLGILPHLMMDNLIQEVDIHRHDTLVLYTDGLTELLNSHHLCETNGENVLLSIFQKGLVYSSIKQEMLAYLSQHSAYMSFSDDISLIDLPCDWEDLLTLNTLADVEDVTDTAKYEFHEADWTLSYTLSGKNLREINPIPLLLNMIKDAGGQEAHRKNIYTILTELYENALLHGLLRIKTHAQYQGSLSLTGQFKKQLIEQIETGFIKINIQYHQQKEQGVYIFIFNDSGDGFDYKNYFSLQDQFIEGSEVSSGRGLELVRQLCEYLTYHDKGNIVEATYRCDLIEHGFE